MNDHHNIVYSYSKLVDYLTYGQEFDITGGTYYEHLALVT